MLLNLTTNCTLSSRLTDENRMTIKLLSLQHPIMYRMIAYFIHRTHLVTILHGFLKSVRLNIPYPNAIRMYFGTTGPPSTADSNLLNKMAESESHRTCSQYHGTLRSIKTESTELRPRLSVIYFNSVISSIATAWSPEWSLQMESLDKFRNIRMQSWYLQWNVDWRQNWKYLGNRSPQSWPDIKL